MAGMLDVPSGGKMPPAPSFWVPGVGEIKGTWQIIMTDLAENRDLFVVTRPVPDIPVDSKEWAGMAHFSGQPTFPYWYGSEGEKV